PAAAPGVAADRQTRHPPLPHGLAAAAPLPGDRRATHRRDDGDGSRPSTAPPAPSPAPRRPAAPRPAGDPVRWPAARRHTGAACPPEECRETPGPCRRIACDTALPTP